jgi:phosphatidylglycerol:prolipoprotein diacylglycerol transferase
MPDGFAIGPLFIRFYGIILMTGAVAGGWLATREAKRRGYDPEIVWDLLVYLIIGGVVGARLWHIFTPPPSSIQQGIDTHFYLTHPFDALAVWNGGLGIPGAVMGGVLALYLYARKNKINFAEWLDIGAPSLALGQAIGRWGNFFNQELYGAPTNLPWKLYIDSQHRLQGYENVSYYHPLFAYESLLNLANMFFLLWIARQYKEKLKTGDVFLVYLIFYPVVRFLLDFLRLDASQVAGVNANQTLMAVVAVGSAATLIWRHRAGADQPAPARAAAVPPKAKPASTQARSQTAATRRPKKKTASTPKASTSPARKPKA